MAQNGEQETNVQGTQGPTSSGWQTASWDLATRLLHWLLAITITLELATSFFIDDSATRLYFYIHEYIGLAAAAAVLLHWMWSFANFDVQLLFPWSGQNWRRVKTEFRDFLHGRLPMGGRRAGLSSFVHGFGMLAVLGMGLTGFFIYLVVPGGRGAMAHSTHFEAFTNLSAIHVFFAWFVWAYWLGHVASTLAHMFRRDRILAPIFLSGRSADRG